MIIAFTGQKGGIGKSTTAVCLAAAAMAKGLRVLLVDADPQGTARTWGEVAGESGRPAPTIVAMGPTMHRQGQLPDMASAYDLTIIDCPPRHGDIQRSALMVADVAVLPCGPTAVDAWALAGTLEVLAEARTLRADLRACVLITRKQGRTALGKGARAVLETSGLGVLRTELGYRIAYQEAVASGQGVTTYSPRDPAAREIVNLLEEIQRFHHGQEASPDFAAQTAVA
ncbi:MAG: ParA family partition ATPase [Minicystis sp.]